MKRKKILALISLGGSIGCASSAGNSPSPVLVPESASEPMTAPVIPRDDRSRVWRITPTSEVGSYQSILKTTIVEKNSPDNRKDGSTTTADYLLTLNRSSNVIGVSGSVSSVEIKPDQTGQIPQSPKHSVGFAGSVSDHNVSLHLIASGQFSSSTPCNDSSESALSVVNRDLIIVPQEITASQSWQDSTAHSLCSGSLPVVVSVIRSYRIIGETVVDGIPALKLERIEKSVTSGEGSQGQHQITLTGTGTGKGQIYIDRMTGLLLGLTSTSQVELSIKSSGRTQLFTQTTEETVVRKSLQ